MAKTTVQGNTYNTKALCLVPGMSIRSTLVPVRLKNGKVKLVAGKVERSCKDEVTEEREAGTVLGMHWR